MSFSRLRITGGTLRGRRLRLGPEVRPTESRVREALFSIWQAQVPGSRFLDLFAGSGAVGLEAVSRGAHHATLVEEAPRVLALLRQNCTEFAPAQSRVERGHLPDWLRQSKPQPFDLIFADPPYAFTDYAQLLGFLHPWLAPAGEVVFEHLARTRITAPEGWQLVDHRSYGECGLSFFAADPLQSAVGVGGSAV